MKWFGNRNREGQETEFADIKPKSQILQVPEKQTDEAKGKLDRFQDKSPEEQKKSLNEQSQRQKLEHPSNTSSEGDTSKGQLQLERGHETERE